MANPGAELAALDFGNLIGGPLNAVITAQSMAAQSTAQFIKEVGFYPEGKVDAEGNDIGNTPIYVDFKYPKEISPYVPAIGAPGDTLLLPYVAPEAAVTSFTVVANGTDTVTGTGFQTAWAGRKITIPGAAAGTITTVVEVNSPTQMRLSNTVLASVTSLALPAVAQVGDATYPDGRPAYVPSTPAVYQDMKFSVPILTMLPIPFIKVDIITIDFNAKITSMETQSQNTDLSVGVSLEVKQRWPGGSAKLNASVAFKKSTASGSSVERTYSMAIHVQASQDEMPAGMEKLLNLLEGAMISTPGAISNAH
jgi:hypothetical protein